MNQTQAMEYINKLVIGFQRARSVSRENLTKGATLSEKISDRLVESILEDLNPWLFGAKGEAFFKALLKTQEQGKVNGIDFFNFMTIIHRLDPTLQTLIGILTETDFPEPNIEVISQLR